jgi:mitogen-activated protein kinase kinase kinase 7
MGKICAGLWMGMPVAVKLVHRSAHRELQKEAAVLSRLRHPCICSFFGTFAVDGGIAVVLELMECSLHQLLFTEELALSMRVDTPQWCRIAHETAVGIAYLHRNNYMHRDIKTRCTRPPLSFF